MKKLFGTFLLSAFLILVLSFTIKNVEVVKSFTPPGTIKVEGTNLFVDRNEVTNTDWAEYLIALKKDILTNEYQEALPDSGSWFKVYTGKQDDLFGKFANYPVVGITADQVKAYCSWRSKQVNLLNSEFKVYYRLPTAEEWQIITSMSNYDTSNLRELYPYVDRTSNKNSKHLKGIFDNVAEIIEGNNSVAGGYTKQDKHALVYQEETPSAHIGLRCIAEVVSN